MWGYGRGRGMAEAEAEGSMGISLGSHYSISMEEFLQSLCHVMHHG